MKNTLKLKSANKNEKVLTHLAVVEFKCRNFPL